MSETMVLYPEHEKLAKVKDASQAIGEFLDWLGTVKMVQLRQWVQVTETAEGGALVSPVSMLLPLHTPTTDLLAEFFEIDLRKLEAEKRQMLAALREGGGSDRGDGADGG